MQRIQRILVIYRESRGYDGDTGNTKDTVGVKGEKEILLYQGCDADLENPVDVETMLEMHRILETPHVFHYDRIATQLRITTIKKS